MLLFFIGVDFDDRQVTQEEWEKLRSSTPFGRMPVYRDGDMEIPETFAILSHLGRKHDLCGDTETDRIRCDVTIEAWREYGNRVANTFGALSNSEDARKRFLAEEQPSLLADLEAYYLQRDAASYYWAGTSPTIGDFSAFHLIEGLAGQFPDVLKRFHALKSFHTSFAAQPKIKEYLESPLRPVALFYGPKGKIFPRD